MREVVFIEKETGEELMLWDENSNIAKESGDVKKKIIRLLGDVELEMIKNLPLKEVKQLINSVLKNESTFV